MNPILDRREFLGLTAGAVAGTMLQAGTVSASSTGVRVEAIAFDAFPIFDPRPVFALAEEMFPGKGADLAQAWRTRQFEYTWLRTVAGPNKLRAGGSGNRAMNSSECPSGSRK